MGTFSISCNLYCRYKTLYTWFHGIFLPQCGVQCKKQQFINVTRKIFREIDLHYKLFRKKLKSWIFAQMEIDSPINEMSTIYQILANTLRLLCQDSKSLMLCRKKFERTIKAVFFRIINWFHEIFWIEDARFFVNFITITWHFLITN